MNPAAPLSLVERFTAIIELVCKAVACRGGARPIGISGLPVERLPGPLLVLIYNRLRRIIARFKTRVAREAAIPPIPPCPSRPRPNRVRKYQPDPLPRHYAWLRTLILETGGGASQFCHLLTDPEMAALLASSPRLRSILRPLCHMLGIRPAQALPLFPQPPPSQPPDPPPLDASPAKLPKVPSATADGMAAEAAPPILSSPQAISVVLPPWTTPPPPPDALPRAIA